MFGHSNNLLFSLSRFGMKHHGIAASTSLTIALTLLNISQALEKLLLRLCVAAAPCSPSYNNSGRTNNGQCGGFRNYRLL